MWRLQNGQLTIPVKGRLRHGDASWMPLSVYFIKSGYTKFAKNWLKIFKNMYLAGIKRRQKSNTEYNFSGAAQLDSLRLWK